MSGPASELETLLEAAPALVAGADAAGRVVFNRAREALTGYARSEEGIAQEDLPRVFERCWQARRRRPGATAGSASARAIVRHLVELPGGSVQACSPGKGRGTTFAVRLPHRRS